MSDQRRGADTTASQFPRDGQNAFQGKSASEAEKEYDDADSQHMQDGADTTAEESERAEPATSERGASDPAGGPDVGNDADTTAEEPTAGDEAAPTGAEEAEPGEEAPTGREDTGGDDSPEQTETGSEDEDRPAFQYHGTEPESEDHEDYAFISGVDSDQRYETVEDMVNGHEELIQHSQRQAERVEELQETLAEERATKQGEVEEMKARLSIYEEQLGEEDLTDVLAERHMPERFQGVSKEDLPADEQEEYIRARAIAEREAEEQLEETQQKRQQARETAKEREERIQSRMQEAEQALEQVDHERLGMDPSDEPYIREAVAEMSGEEGEMTPFDIGYQVLVAPELMPDQLDFGREQAQQAFDLIVDAVGAKAREKKRQAAQERASKVRKSGTPSSTSGRRGEPEPSTEESARRERASTPEQAFRRAGT